MIKKNYVKLRNSVAELKKTEKYEYFRHTGFMILLYGILIYYMGWALVNHTFKIYSFPAWGLAYYFIFVELKSAITQFIIMRKET